MLLMALELELSWFPILELVHNNGNLQNRGVLLYTSKSVVPGLPKRDTLFSLESLRRFPYFPLYNLISSSIYP